jgi:hypothetical protein
MCKHEFFSAMGRATRDRAVRATYGAEPREDSSGRRYN